MSKHVPDIRVLVPGTSVSMTRISTEYLSYTDIWRSWTIIYRDIPIPRYTRYMTSYTFRKSIYRDILSTEIREKYIPRYTRYMTPYDRAWDMGSYTEHMWSYDGIWRYMSGRQDSRWNHFWDLSAYKCINYSVLLNVRISNTFVHWILRWGFSFKLLVDFWGSDSEMARETSMASPFLSPKCQLTSYNLKVLKYSFFEPDLILPFQTCSEANSYYTTSVQWN